MPRVSVVPVFNRFESLDKSPPVRCVRATVGLKLASAARVGQPTRPVAKSSASRAVSVLCGPAEALRRLSSIWDENGGTSGSFSGAARYRVAACGVKAYRSEEHTSELQSLMRISYAVFCLKKKTQN